MNSNLPPGCRDLDIPGNGPEDEAFDCWFENNQDKLKDLSDEQINRRFENWIENDFWNGPYFEGCD